MVVLSDKCMKLCMNHAKYPALKHNYLSMSVFALMSIGSAVITDNVLNVLFIIIIFTVCYGVIIKRQQVLDETKYNHKSRHPIFKLIEELGWNQTYKNLLQTVENTKGFVFKPDKLFVTQYQIFNYIVITIPEWNEYNILCRGLIIDPSQEKVIAASFPKFFNFQEFHPDIQKTLIKRFIAEQDTIQINEKLDGSLGIIFYCDTTKQWRCSTRGSMASDQAVWATNYLKKHRKVYENVFVSGHTYLAEIIYSDNKILINYAFEGLVLLAAYNDSGYEYKYEYLQEIANKMSPYFRISKTVRFNSVNELVNACEQLEVNKEGWVVTFECGMRIKFKGKEYLALAKVARNITENMVKRALVEDGLSEKTLLDTIPEEFHEDVQGWYEAIWNEIAMKSKDIAYDLIATNQLSNADLGKFIKSKREGNAELQLEFRSKKSEYGGLFLARKYLNETLWMVHLDDCDVDDKVDEIVVEMMKNKGWKKFVMKK